MTAHTEYPLRCASISQILNLALAVSASKAVSAKGLVAREDGQILNLISTGVTAVGAIVAD